MLIAAGVDGYPEGHDAAALGAMLARASRDDLMLVPVDREPIVVLPAELGWTATRERSTRTSLAGLRMAVPSWGPVAWSTKTDPPTSFVTRNPARQ